MAFPIGQLLEGVGKNGQANVGEVPPERGLRDCRVRRSRKLERDGRQPTHYGPKACPAEKDSQEAGQLGPRVPRDRRRAEK